MSFINHAAKEVNCKIIYYGPGLSGKTTNVQYIYEKTREDRKGNLVTLSSENERTLFFDFLPLSVGSLRGFNTRFHLYSVPGQTFYQVSREFILKGVDGIVFVADSQEDRMEENLQNLESLEKSLERQGYDIARLPIVFQYNKRDLPKIVSTEELEATLNSRKHPFFEGVAIEGIGVMETLDKMCDQVIEKLKKGAP